VKQCPLCLGQIPDAALKCQHCGEWIDGRAAGGSSELGRALNRLISVKIAIALIGLVLALLFFFLIWLPERNKFQRDFDNFPSSPSLVK
jgi:uncharacterized membrane protein YvbJ